jgi:hypothetical protein
MSLLLAAPDVAAIASTNPATAQPSHLPMDETMKVGGRAVKRALRRRHDRAFD